MNSLLAAEGKKLNSGAGGLGGGISRRVFSSCFRRASFAAAWRLAGESFSEDTPLLPEEPFKLDGEAFQKQAKKGRNTNISTTEMFNHKLNIFDCLRAIY